ncbi:MAG TPA: hypothetical protein VFG33_09610 [Kribbella sp.]|uniref:hypothetical protein n=1 Tax=Kribbella sp. TaxID=1871183 RepID=UPI002D77F4DF|nr:hypothetical protein [Kribbella sp.]HET6293622.1 hypothetical protein [Kribbella sp.]
MPDPLTLSALGATALTEGIKFLYSQATELLKQRRERAAKPAKPVDTTALAGELEPLKADDDVATQVEAELKRLRHVLQDYVDDIVPIDPKDRELLEATDEVRRLLEAVYGQRITFRGEHRPESGPLVQGSVDALEVAGYVAAVRAKTVGGSATVQGTVRTEEVREGGQAIGVDIDRIG